MYCISVRYNSVGFSIAEIDSYFGLHYSRVSRIVKNQLENLDASLEVKRQGAFSTV